MYQSIYYDYPSKTYFLRDDSDGWSEFQYQPTFYKRINEYKEGALPVLTGGWAYPTKKYDKSDTNLLEKDINKELVVLRELYYELDDVIPKFHNILFFDIETEMGGALTPEYIKASPMSITAIALLDRQTKQKICFILDKTGEIKALGDENKKIIPCGTEKELILKFLDKWEELDPTIVVGYNSSYFDIPYLYYRISNTLGESTALRLSPIKKINIQEWDETTPIRLGGVNHLDFMLLHKKYIMREEPSYKLKDIGPKYAKMDKIEYEGNLNQLFKNDPQLFIDYNIRDVEIIDALEDNLKFIELTILISHICNIPYDQIYYNTVMNEGAILKYLRREGIVSPNKPTTHNPNLKPKLGEKQESYAGGYIKEPEPGLYFDVIDLDFTSLYPSIIKSLNLGIETLIGRIKSNKIKYNYEQELSLEKLKEKDPEEILIVERLNPNNYKLESSSVTIKKLIEIVETNKYTISASGGIFKTDVQSVCSKILAGWFEKREYYRGLKKKAGKAEDWKNYKLYDLFQHAFKILQNAMYGTYAISGWRYTDGHKICSASITNSGQRLTQESITFVNDLINNELKIKDGDYIIISDTDSLYIRLQELIKHRYGLDLNKEEKNKKILEIANEIQTKANENLNLLSKNLFNIDFGKHYFQLKQEVIAQSVLTTGKRRYGMYVTNKEGVAVEEFDAKGLELFKSNMNKIFRSFGEELIKNILFGKPKKDIDKSIIDLYKSLKDMNPRLLGKPVGVHQIKNQIKKTAGSGEIFSKFESGAPWNTKAAVRYNDLLKFKGLDKKYESIIEGDKIFVVDLKANPFQIETIAIPNSKLPDEMDKFIKEYIDVDSIFESILLNKLKELYKDIKWSFPELNPHVTKFFVFK